MTLYVTRHGETDYNVQGRYAGTTDTPLNGNGLRQAEELAVKLSSADLNVIVSSPLLRARQTADIIRKAFGVPLTVMEEFAEINLGVYEGLTREEAQTRYPDMWARLSSRPPDVAPDGGETHRQFDAKVAAGMEKLKSMYNNSNVLLVCHALTARVINRQIQGLSFEDMHKFTIMNCEAVKYIL
jgi:probable phosphoglycerate mutase